MPVNSLYLLSGNLMIALAIGVLFWWRKRHLVPWPYFLWGALAWTVTVATKAAWAILFNRPVLGWLQAHAGPGADPLFWAYVGGLTGVFECGLALPLIRAVPSLREADRGQAIGFGLGFGAIEAFLLGTASLIGSIGALAGRLPGEMMQLFQHQGPILLWILAPVVERMGSLFMHAVAGTWLIYTVLSGNRRYFWLAFAYKSLIDAFAVFSQMDLDLSQLGQVWLVEAVVMTWALLGYQGLSSARSLFASLQENTDPT